MYYKYRLTDNRILSASPQELTYNQDSEGLLVVDDATAYEDRANVYRVTSTMDGVEVDPTFTQPGFDLTTRELRAILKLIVDQFNVIRNAAGLPTITYTQARDTIKTELGL